MTAECERPAARLVEVTVRAPGRPAPVLDGVSLGLEAGERMLVLGPSGSGKSSLLQVLTGVIPFSQNLAVDGAVHLDGVDVTHVPVIERSRRLGVVAQDPAAAVCLARVDQEVALPLENHGVASDRISDRVDEALRLAGAVSLRERATDGLSGGEVQRVALAAALAARPAVLLLDEPTSMLDPAGVRAVRAAIDGAVAGGGAAVLLVEHRLDDLAGVDGARGLPERALVLDEDGRMFATGPTVRVLAEHAAHLHAAGCWLPLESELLAVTGHSGGLAAAPVASWLREPRHPAAPPRAAAPAEATRAGAPPRAILRESTSREVPRGVVPGELLSHDVSPPWAASRVAVLGDVPARGDVAAAGAGGGAVLSARGVAAGRAAQRGRWRAGRSRRRRADVAPVLSGVDLELQAGEVVALLGANGSGKTTLLLTLAGLLPPLHGAVTGSRPSMVFQYPELQFLGHRVRDEIAVGLTGRAEEVHDIVERRLRIHRLEHVADRDPYRLSGGEKRRLSLAAMLAHVDRPVLLADEPTFGLDRRDTLATADVFRHEAAAGRAVLFSSHDLRFVATVADRVVVLADGRVAADGPTLTVLRDAALRDRAGLELPDLLAWLLAELDDTGTRHALRRLAAAHAHPHPHEAPAPPPPARTRPDPVGTTPQGSVGPCPNPVAASPSEEAGPHPHSVAAPAAGGVGRHPDPVVAVSSSRSGAQPRPVAAPSAGSIGGHPDPVGADARASVGPEPGSVAPVGNSGTRAGRRRS